MNLLILCDDVIKMLKDNLSDGSNIGGIGAVNIRFFDVETVRVQPEFAIYVAFVGVDVRRFVSLVRVKEQSPAANEQDGGHRWRKL